MSIRPLIALIAFHAFIADAQEKSTAPATPAPPAPVPTHADVSFGPHPHQLIDIYLPKKGTAPFPALLWFGGIWKAAKHPANLGFFEQQGIAVIAVERRTMEDATAAKDADIAAALKAKGADITETKGVVAGVAFRDCSALGAGDYALLRQLAQLKSLSLGKGFGDAALKALGALPELEMLSTNGMEVSDDGIRALTACKKLKTFSIFHPGKNFTGRGLAALVALPALERLTVAGSAEFADAGMEAVAALMQLKEFRTWHSGVTLDGVKKMRALKNLTSLTLGQRLSYAPPVTLSDEAVTVLAECLSLESLSLQEARLTLPALAQLKKLPKLKRLTLDGIDIAESDIAALKQQLPKTDVRWTAPTEQNKKRIEALFKTAKR